MSKIFEDEKAMLKQLEAMGMPPAMLANLTDEQKKKMFAMTLVPEIISKAQERVVHEEEWKEGNGYQWKNSREDVFLRLKIEEKKDVQCSLEENHMKILVGGNVVVDKQLFQAINKKESTWEVKGDVLAVALRKATAPMRWLAVFR